MSWLVKSLVLPLVLLCFWGLREGAQACKCGVLHPQQAFCLADVVIKATVIGLPAAAQCEDCSELLKVDINQTQMFKGPNKEFNAFYTAPSSAACGVNLTSDVEYVITGGLDSNGSLHVSLCNYFKWWDDLSATEKEGLVLTYQLGCDCAITRCNSVPCSSSPAECLWPDFLMEKVFRHFTCIKRSDGSCAWYRGRRQPQNGVSDIGDASL
nr:metalloproteinase inhibitor 2-like [Nerophis lumbriciformis]